MEEGGDPDDITIAPEAAGRKSTPKRTAKGNYAVGITQAKVLLHTTDLSVESSELPRCSVSHMNIINVLVTLH